MIGESARRSPVIEIKIKEDALVKLSKKKRSSSRSAFDRRKDSVLWKYGDALIRLVEYRGVAIFEQLKNGEFPFDAVIGNQDNRIALVNKYQSDLGNKNFCNDFQIHDFEFGQKWAFPEKRLRVFSRK